MTDPVPDDPHEICAICGEPRSAHVPTAKGPLTHPREARNEGYYDGEGRFVEYRLPPIEDAAVKARYLDIKEHPERHRHDFNGLMQCSLVRGAIDGLLMEAHETFAPERRCDVVSGPCSCGGFHR